MRKRSYFILRLLIRVAIFAIGFFALLTFVITMYRNTGNNMFPSVRSGDGCIFYKLDSYSVSDVVLYRTETGQRKTGRIVALAPLTVDFPESGGYTVNGAQPVETITYETTKSEKGDIEYPLTIKKGYCFILNDFRSDTKDSREYGPIKLDRIEGKLIFVLRRRGF